MPSTSKSPKRPASARMKAADEHALKNFDNLPDSATVRLPVVTAWRGISPATAWRHVSRGLLPAPVRVGLNAVGWRVGDLRKHVTISEAAA